MSRNFRNLGNMAEDKFQHWANEVGITVNPVRRDMGGWDYFLQFASTDCAKCDALDLNPPEITCLVQVKGTDHNEKKIKMALSNWSKLAKVPLPVFFVVINYAGRNDPISAHFIHLDKYWMEKTLKRLRLITDTDSSSLHKKTMNLTYSEDNRLESLSGECIENAIRRYVGGDFSNYVQTKLNLISTLGYEGSNIQGTLRFQETSYESMMEKLVDFSIGSQKELSIIDVEFEDVRFGIPKSTKKFDKMKMQFGELPSSGHAFVCISDEIGNDIVAEKLEFYHPASVFPFIPQEYWKLRYKSDWLNIVLSVRSQKANIQINIYEKRKDILLSQMAKAAHCIRKLERHQIKDYKMDIRHGTDFISSKLDNMDRIVIDPIINRVLITIENAVKIHHLFEIHDDPKIQIESLMNQEFTIYLMLNLMENATFNRAAISFEKNIELPTELSNIAFLYAFPVIIENMALFITGCIK